MTETRLILLDRAVAKVEALVVPGRRRVPAEDAGRSGPQAALF